jgi:precorrin-6Y C5,15-methyltransferase (decarboxylating)
MYKVLVFAGTTEGYEICRFLADHQVRTMGFAATEYGGKSLTENEYLTVQTGRLDETAMEQVFIQEKPEMVLDATHPYAAEVTVNICTACEKTQTLYRRVLRESGSREDKAVYVESVQAAAQYLDQTQGNVLLTTGSKELAGFTGMKNYQERLYARVLSLPNVMQACAELGFEGKHLIGMQGPFSRELNAAMLRQYRCKYLVTKDTGKAGGFQDKIDAALECDAVPVIIGRPLKEEGMSVKECKRFLTEYFSLTHQPHITLLGIGMGSREMLTVQGKNSLDQADLLIGARRMVDSVRRPDQDVFIEYRSQEIKDYIDSHPEYDNIVIVLSGDVGFYSGAKKLLDVLQQNKLSQNSFGSETAGQSSSVQNTVKPEIQVQCGISSVVYFMSKIGLSWDDAKIVSAHGRRCNLISYIHNEKKVFAILGTSDGVAVLASKLVDYGMSDVLLYVGENLSYDNEKIFVKTAGELTEYTGNPLSVICAVNESAGKRLETHGIKDEEFIRGKAPMTKEEVRTVSLSKLRLTEDSVCYDVGAGTGSLSIEMALRAHQGKVWAIEKKEDAVELIRQNKVKFAADNLEIIEGLAPEALKDLPVPTHAFIGGSSGNLKEIVQILIEKNPQVRIVINCITLETVSEALETAKEFGFEENEIVQLSAARSKAIGRYHMMMGENPIYIITLQNPQK